MKRALKADMKTEIILTRIYHSMEEEFGHLSKFGYVEISNGLCTLAAVLRQKSYNVEIVDAMALKLGNQELANAINDKSPRYLGISACTMDIIAAADLAARVKSLKPSIRIIIGGPHITALPKETMEEFSVFDIGVIGEGEETLPELLDVLDGRIPKKLTGVDGLVFRENSALVVTKPRAFIKDLDALPLPAWDLLPNLRQYYFAPAWTMHSGQTATIITSRGCPCQCIYCDRKVFGNVVRYHGPEYVLEMMRTVHKKHDIGHLRIGDDNFVINKKRLHAICDRLIGEKMVLSWSCLARVDSVDPEMLAKMKKAGCWSIAVGVETGSQKIHDIEKKGVTLDRIEKAVAMIRKAGIRTISFNIVGHPLETVETMKKTIEFNKRIKVDEFKTQFMVPFPGTELYQNADLYGTLEKDWKKMTVFNDPIFIPYGLRKEDLIEWNKRGFRSFYLQPRIVLGYIRNIRSFSELWMMVSGGFTIITWELMKFFNMRTRHKQAASKKPPTSGTR